MTSAETNHDAALGCLMGACVGDAAGAVLEFMGRKPNETDVEWAMTMPGGGCWQVAPGQITDDGELTLGLAQSTPFQSEATEATIESVIEAVAARYNAWHESDPFDIGNTTRNAIGGRKAVATVHTKGYAGVMTEAAALYNMQSKSNGSLMRATPLGIWGHRLADAELAAMARADSQLSHPNPSCGDAVACYVIAIASLVRTPGDRQTAFQRARQWATEHANPEVRGWLADAENDIGPAYHPLAGFVRIGFTHAFRHLLLGTDYATAVQETLLGGGDTDTNACIVGGLVGTAGGIKTIPNAMQTAVLQCDTNQGANPRPEFLHPAQIPNLVETLIRV